MSTIIKIIIILILPILQRRELAYPGHTTSKWESWDSNSGIHTLIDYVC